MFVAETRVSCFDAARPEYWLFVALSPVFVQLVFPITVRFASVTYRLLLESAISAVVASAPAVTSPFASYVTFVLVAPVIAPLACTFSVSSSSIAACTVTAAILPAGTFVILEAV